VLKNIENVEDKKDPVDRDENEVDDGNGGPDSHGSGRNERRGLRRGGDDAGEGKSGRMDGLNMFAHCRMYGPFLGFVCVSPCGSALGPHPARDGSPSKQNFQF
jgi:hypothetical protein